MMARRCWTRDQKAKRQDYAIISSHHDNFKWDKKRTHVRLDAPEAAGVELRALVTLAPDDVEEGVKLAVEAPMEKVPVEAKTFVIFPTSTASNE